MVAMYQVSWRARSASVESKCFKVEMRLGWCFEFEIYLSGFAILFLHNSMLTSLLCISVLLCTIKMKFGLSLWYTFGRFVFKFHKVRMGDDVIMTSFKFSPNNFPYLKFYWIYLYNFIPGTNTQQHDVHLMIKMKVTLIDYQGPRCRPKVTKMN